MTQSLEFETSHRFCVAPMMDWTDRHCRYFHRLLSRHARLYTEMVVAEAILRGDRERLLRFNPEEHPVALQVGGADPHSLAAAARIGEDAGYDEINLNVGCPSDRVQSGCFGAQLMKTPDRVAECVAAMRASVSRVPVTVKCRIGVDDQDPEQSLFEFVETVAAAGCALFIVHARKAWLSGLSPKENRTVPPLNYDLAARLKASRPDLTVVLNGGLTEWDVVRAQLPRFDGVMLGRAAYDNPYMLAEADRELFGDQGAPLTREDVTVAMIDYVEAHVAAGGKAHDVTRHMLGLYHGERGARGWRRALSGGRMLDTSALREAAAVMRERALEPQMV